MPDDDLLWLRTPLRGFTLAALASACASVLVVPRAGRRNIAMTKPGTGPGFVVVGCLTMTYFRMGIHTIIGVLPFHGPVRDGKGWCRRAVVVRHWRSGADVGSAPGRKK